MSINESINMWLIRRRPNASCSNVCWGKTWGEITHMCDCATDTHKLNITGPPHNRSLQLWCFTLATPAKLKSWPALSHISYANTVSVIHSIESLFMIKYRIQTGTRLPSGLNASLHKLQNKPPILVQNTSCLRLQLKSVSKVQEHW